jgi:hypothetical protein
MRAREVRILAMVVCGFSGEPVVAQQGTDMRLANAGFVMRPANTPEKMARLRHLPGHKFVARTKADGARYFLYADPDYCKCLLVGDQRAMQTYRDMVSPPPTRLQGIPGVSGPTARAGAEHAMIEEMNSDLSSAIPDRDFLDFLH